MVRCVFDKGSKEFLRGSRWDDIPFDADTEVRIELSDFPDPKTERWDGDKSVRRASPQEEDEHKDKDADRKASADLDKTLSFQVLVTWLAPKFGLTPQQARNELAPIYRQLFKEARIAEKGRR